MSTGRYDAIVVGARCAGSPTAMLLARKGYRVLLVDKATLPERHDVHALHPSAWRSPRWSAGGCWTAWWRRAARRSTTLLVRLRAAHDRRLAAAGRRDRARRTARAAPSWTRSWSTPRSRRARRCARASRSRRSWSTTARVTGVRGHARAAPGHRARARGHRRRRQALDGRQGGASPSSTTSGRRAWRCTTPTGATCPSTGFEIYGAGRAAPRLGAIPTNDGLTVVAVGWPRRGVPRPTARTSRATSWRPSSSRPSSPSGCARPGASESSSARRSCPTTSASPTAPAGRCVGDAGYHKDPITAHGHHRRLPRRRAAAPAAIDDGLAGRRSLRRRDGRIPARRATSEARPIYEFTDEFAQLVPPPPEMQRLFGAIARRPGGDGRVRQRPGGHACGAGVLRARERRADHGARRRRGGLTSDPRPVPPVEPDAPGRQPPRAGGSPLHGSRADIVTTPRPRRPPRQQLHDPHLVGRAGTQDDDAAVLDEPVSGTAHADATRRLLLEGPERGPRSSRRWSTTRNTGTPDLVPDRWRSGRAISATEARSIVTGVDFVSIPTSEIGARDRLLRRDAGPPSLGVRRRPELAEFETGHGDDERLRPGADGGIGPAATPPPTRWRSTSTTWPPRAALEARGDVRRRHAPDTGVCHMAFFADPDGNALMLHHRYAPTRRRAERHRAGRGALRRPASRRAAGLNGRAALGMLARMADAQHPPAALGDVPPMPPGGLPVRDLRPRPRRRDAARPARVRRARGAGA